MKTYTCSACGLKYEEESWAKKCSDWCTAHNSCNLEIIKHAVSDIQALKTYTFHVSGTHCASCKILIEDVLKEQDFVKNVRVNLKRETVEIETDNDQNAETLAQILTDKIKPNGHSLSVGKTIQENKSSDVIWQAIPIG